MSVDFKNAVPGEFLIQRPVSTSKAILRKNLMEILPNEQTTYSPSTNTNIRFNISSNTDFLIGTESYFRFSLYRTEGATYDDAAALDVGGVHSLFRSIEVRALSSGILLQRYDHYNKYYALSSLISHSPEDVEYYGAPYGDSMSILKTENPYKSGAWKQVTGTFGKTTAGVCASVGGASRVRSEIEIGDMISMEGYSDGISLTYTTFDYDDTGGASERLVTLTGGDAVNELEVGDVLMIHSTTADLPNYQVVVSAVLTANTFNILGLTADLADAAVVAVYTDNPGAQVSHLAEVTAITDDDTFTLNPPGFSVLDRASAYVLKKNLQTPARMRAVQTSGVANARILEFKPLLAILQHNLPLFVMKGGIEITFELDNAQRCIQSGLDLEDSTVDFDYTISTPRFMAMMSTPHGDVVDEYVRQWKSEMGLVYAIPSVRTRRITGTDTTNVNLQMNVGVRSARRAYTVIQDSLLSEGSGALSRSVPCQSLFLRSSISSFQMKVGSHEFPNRRVACDQFSTECLEQLKNVAKTRMFRFSPKDWYSVNSIKVGADDSVNNESLHFIMGVDLSRDSGFDSNLTGVDLSIVPLDLDIERSATYTNDGLNGVPVYITFVEHDAFLKISIDQVAVMN